jgi:hypothetical protein
MLLIFKATALGEHGRDGVLRGAGMQSRRSEMRHRQPASLAAGIEFHAGRRLGAIIPTSFRTAAWARSFAVQQVDALQRPRFVAQCSD